MTFPKSPQASGAASAGLRAGTCSWIDRPVNDAEPAVIRFDTNPAADPGSDDPNAAEWSPDARTIPQYLRGSDHYWSFFVFNTNRGYFQAKRHQSWKSANDGFVVKGEPRRKPPVYEMLPRNSVRLDIQYKKEYGYGNTANAFGGNQRSCSAFGIGVTSSAGPPPVLIGIPATGTLLETADRYICEYLFTDLPLDYPMTIELTMREPTQAWTGGSEAEPPPGQQRTIVDPTRTVTLTKNQSRATLTYDMIYAPRY